MQISADRKKLLYLQSEPSGYLWIANNDGSGARQITFDERLILRPSFSPDGRRLLFSMYDPGFFTSHIYLMNRDGSSRQQLAFGSETVHDYEWSPDGQWIAYCSAPGSAPRDSSNVYLIAASNPAAPRLLGRGSRIWWINPKTLIVSRQLKNWIFSIEGAPPQKFFADSTRVYPFPEEKYVLFKDFRKGREGWWIVPVAGLNTSATGPSRKILPENSSVSIARNGKSILYPKYGNNVVEIRKISLPDGKDELFPVNFPNGNFSLAWA